MIKPKQAVILAGGKDLGLDHYKILSKTFSGYKWISFIFYIIQELEKYNFSDVLILLVTSLETFKICTNISKTLKIKISFHYSPPNFTGSRLKAASNYLEDTFFCCMVIIFVL